MEAQGLHTGAFLSPGVEAQGLVALGEFGQVLTGVCEVPMSQTDCSGQWSALGGHGGGNGLESADTQEWEVYGICRRSSQWAWDMGGRAVRGQVGEQGVREAGSSS